MPTLRAVPTWWFSWHIRLLEGERKLTVVEHAFLGQGGGFRLEGSYYDIHRESLLGPWVLRRGGEVLARAEKQGIFSRRWTVTAAGRRLRLRASSLVARTFVLEDDGRPFGRIRRDGLFGRSARVELPDEIPLPAAAFIVFLVYTFWRRQATAAGS